jgi:hypothetical protein
MSSGTPAEISIGGKIPVSLVQPLCQAIAAGYLALDWGDVPFHPRSAEDLRQACSERDEVVVLWMCDDQAGSGQFESLEAFLQSNHIAFRRRCDGTSEFGPEIVEFRPHLGLAAIPIDATGEAVAPLAPMRQVKARLARALDMFKQGNPRGLATVRSAYKLLRKQLPRRFPSLEPFEIDLSD